MSEVKPVLYLGTKLVPYEERTFRIADMRDAMGYTHDHKQFYSEEQVQKLLAESERLRAKYQQAAESSEHFAARAERLAEAVQGGVAMLERLHGDMGPCEESDAVWGVRDTLKTALARAALDQEGGNG